MVADRDQALTGKHEGDRRDLRVVAVCLGRKVAVMKAAPFSW